MRTLGRLARGAGLAAWALLLTGCSPISETGVTAASDGVPSVISCGGRISAVAVFDANTGRQIWAAESVAVGHGDVDDVGDVRLGELPASGWRETVRYQPEPRPRSWLFEVDERYEPVVIVVPADEVDEGTVFRPEGRESRAHFEDVTCAGLPVVLPSARVLLGVTAIAGALAAGLAIVIRNRQAERPGQLPPIKL